MKKPTNNRKNGNKQKKNKSASTYRKVVSSSLLAVSLTTGLMSGAAGAVSPSTTQDSNQPPVYQGDSLQHFQTMLLQQQSIQLMTDSEDAPVITPGNGGSTYVPTPAPAASSLIPAQRSSEQTPNSASLDVAKTPSGEQVAKFKLLTDGIKAAADKAVRGDTIAIVVPSLTGSARIEADIPGAALASIAGKAAALSIQTGDVSIRVPVSELKLTEAAAALGLTSAAEMTVQMQIVKQTAQAADGTTAISEGYVLTMIASANGQQFVLSAPMMQFATLTVPLTQAVSKPAQGAAFVIEDGQYYPVPVSFDEAGNAVVHSTRSGQFVIVEQPPAPALTEATGKHWAANAIQSLGTKQILDADEIASFNPDSQVSRLAFATLIVRALGLEGSEQADGPLAFRDVEEGTRAATIIQTAVEAGLFKGIAADQFAPDAPMTREQMAAVLIRAAEAFQLELPDTAAEGSDFRDLDAVSEWAREDMRQAIASGLIQGMGNGSIASKQAGTQSQSAAVIIKLLQKTGLSN